MFRFSALRRISLLVCFCFAAMPWRVAGQCTFYDLNGPGTYTWSSNQTRPELVRVKNGATLIINNNAVISFSASCSGILIETGGKLIIDHAILTKTTSGNFLWKGIEAQPDPGISITSQFCEISYAQTAVKLNSGLIGANLYSARIEALAYTTFRNNQVGISKTGYNSPGAAASTIQWAAFTMQSVQPGVPLQNPITFISLNLSDEVNINGVNFRNFANDVYWVRGIVITGNLGRTVTIDDGDFADIAKGVYVENSSIIHTVKNSSFFIPTPAYTSSGGVITPVYGDTYGIMAVASKVKAQDNTFTGVQRDMLNPKRAYGIVFDNTASGGSMSFRNTFSGMDVGFQSQLNNIQAVVSCNNFNGFAPNPYQSNKRYSWITVGGSGAFMRNQGLSCAAHNTPAGNEWSAACTNSTHDVEIRVSPTMQNWLYYAHALNTSFQPTTVPDCSTPAWKNVNLNVCAQQTGGYQKQSTSCTQPFAYPPGFSKNEEAVFTPYDPAKPDDFFSACRQYVDGIKASLGNDASGQQEVVYYEGLMQWASNEVVTNLLNEGKTADAITWLEQSPLAEDAKTLCLLSITTGQGIAQTGLDAFAKRINETVYSSAEYEQHYRADAAFFVQLINLLSVAASEGRLPDKFSEAEIKELESIAKITSETGVVAEGFLEQATGKQNFHEPIYVEDDAESFKMDENEQEVAFSISPNPTDGNFNVHYQTEENALRTELVIYDIAGKEAARFTLAPGVSNHRIAQGTLQRGVYIVRITQDGVHQHLSKLIIQ